MCLGHEFLGNLVEESPILQPLSGSIAPPPPILRTLAFYIGKTPLPPLLLPLPSLPCQRGLALWTLAEKATWPPLLFPKH